MWREMDALVLKRYVFTALRCRWVGTQNGHTTDLVLPQPPPSAHIRWTVEDPFRALGDRVTSYLLGSHPDLEQCPAIDEVQGFEFFITDRLAGILRGLTKERLKVSITEHSSAVSNKVVIYRDESVRAQIIVVMKEHATVLLEADIRLLKEQSQVLVLLANSPDKGRIISLNSSKYVVYYVNKPASLSNI